MADEHHEDHGNTAAAWFLTVSWIGIWCVAGAAVILGQGLVLWTVVALGASVVCAVISGVMKKAGLGRREPRTAPATPSAESQSGDPRDATDEVEPTPAVSAS